MCAVASVVPDSVTPWTVARQSLLCPGILQARILERAAMCFSRDNPGGPVSISWQAKEADLRLQERNVTCAWEFLLMPKSSSLSFLVACPEIMGFAHCLNQFLATYVSHWFCFSGWYAWKTHQYSETSQTGIGLLSELVAHGSCSFPLRYPNQRQERRTSGGFVYFVYASFFNLFKWITFKLLKILHNSVVENWAYLSAMNAWIRQFFPFKLLF